MELKIREVGEDDFEDSVIAEIENGSGNVMRILLPKDKDDWDNINPRGLNFISTGHYQ